MSFSTVVRTKSGRVNLSATVRETADMLLRSYDDVSVSDVLLELACQGFYEISEKQVSVRLSQNFYCNGQGYYSHIPEWARVQP